MLYQINKTTPANSVRVPIESPEALGINEKHIEDFLASHLVELIPEDQLMLLAQERQFQEEADILALDKVGTLFIFELKRWKSNAENLLQVMRYGQIFGRYDYQRLEQLVHRHQRLEGSLRAKHQEYFSLSAPLPEEAFNADQRFVVVTNGVDRDTLQAIKYWDRKGVKIDSLTYKLYRIRDQPYIQFETYNPELDLQLEENPGVYIVNTNFSYMEDAWKEMVGDGRTGKAAAYYDRKNAVRRISKGSTVFLYHTGSGVVAKGRATAPFQVTDQGGIKDEQYYVPLQFEWALTDPELWGKLAPKAFEINAGTNASNRFRQTVFNASKDMADAIQAIHDRKIAAYKSADAGQPAEPRIQRSHHTGSRWSDALIEQTRSALRSPPVILDCNLSFKNVDGRFGQIGLSDLTSEALRVTDSRSGGSHLYESVDALISAGWVVD